MGKQAWFDSNNRYDRQDKEYSKDKRGSNSGERNPEGKTK